jgi:hypothetical protein
MKGITILFYVFDISTGPLFEVCFKRTYNQVVLTGTGLFSDSRLSDNCNIKWFGEGVEVSAEERGSASETY